MRQFLLPDLGEGLEDAQLVQWLVRPGDPVQLNQPICQVETAKAMVDIPSPFAGTVQQLHANPGDTVPVGAPLVTIAEADSSSAGANRSSTRQAEGVSDAVLVGRPTEGAPYGTYELSAPEASGAILVGYGTEGPAQIFARRRRVSRAHGQEPEAPAVPTPAPSATNGVVNASPLVRKMAAERGIDLSAIAGTGPGGRIRVEDLEAALANPATSRSVGASGVATGGRPPASASVGPLPAAPASDDEERISTVGLRKAIAARMVRAATTIPHFTEYSQFDASALVALRERLKADPAFAGAKLTFLPFFVRALVRAVQAYPILNSRWDEDGNAIVVKRSVHVGIATDTPRGLLVPVVHNAHQLALPQIAAECGRLVALAREGKADPKSLSGSTITITNVGAAGPVDTGAPLINPPEACVVGFGAIKPRPTVVGDALAVRPGCWISISCDHRIVDGAAAAQFMGVLVDALEHPESLGE